MRACNDAQAVDPRPKDANSPRQGESRFGEARLPAFIRWWRAVELWCRYDRTHSGLHKGHIQKLMKETDLPISFDTLERLDHQKTGACPHQTPIALGPIQFTRSAAVEGESVPQYV